MTSNWPRIIALWLIGIFAAGQLAKVATLAPALRLRFGLTLAQTGLLVSLLEIGGALFGFAAGLAVGRFGTRRFLFWGLAILLLAGAVEAAAPNGAVFFAARAVEGIGYLLVVIALPTAIVTLTDEHNRGAALTLWSSFFAVGVAIGSVVTGFASGLAGPGGALWFWAAIAAAAPFLVAKMPIPTQADRRAIALPATAAWLSTFAFGLYTMAFCSLTMLLPTFLIEATGTNLATASIVVGLVSLASLLATAIGAWPMRAGPVEGRRVIAIVAPTLLLSALAAPTIFLAARPTGAALLATSAIAILVVLLSTIAAPFIFARLPLMAGARAADDPRIAAVNGLVTQFGAGGALIGPPLAGLVVERWGWTALGFAMAAILTAMLAMVCLAEYLLAAQSTSAGRSSSSKKRMKPS
jgi:CP family cyanate transporter-like MFS transporter